MVVLDMFNDMAHWYANHFSVIFISFYEHQILSFILLTYLLHGAESFLRS